MCGCSDAAPWSRRQVVSGGGDRKGVEVKERPSRCLSASAGHACSGYGLDAVATGAVFRRHAVDTTRTALRVAGRPASDSMHPARSAGKGSSC